MQIITLSILGIALFFLLNLFVTIKQGHVGVMSIFGKFHGVLLPGLSWIPPWVSVAKISIQNHAEELNFQAITLDQANVYFGCTLIFLIRKLLQLSSRI